MKVAITGGIGSGKSAVSAALRKAGKVVYDADAVNAELLEDEGYLQKLRTLFPEAFSDEGLDKRKLAETIFSSSEKREALNAVAHPAILAKIRALDNCYVEVPLLFESGAEGMFDKVITVVCPKEVKIERLKKRSGLTKEQAERIMQTQFSDEERTQKSDFVIVNDKGFDELEKQVEKIAETILI